MWVKNVINLVSKPFKVTFSSFKFLRENSVRATVTYKKS